MSYSVGLTGGIGSGKSTVASEFEKLGVPIIDTDLISHQLTQPGGAALAEIKAAFGNEYINSAGSLDRDKMRASIFADQVAKRQLEQILHPLILAQARKLAQASTAPYVLLVIPLLFESGTYQGWLKRTLTVDCAEATQLARTTTRPGMNSQIAAAIMAQQISREQRLTLADDVIQNDGNLDDLHAQVGQLHQNYLQLAQLSN